MMQETPVISSRNRAAWGGAAVAVMALGLASRRFPALFPAVLGKYPGDALWALMIYTGGAVLFPKASIVRIASLALIICGLIEILKLYQAPWLVSLRHTTLGHLIFGHAFSGQNLVAYAVGVFTGMVIESLIQIYRRRARRKFSPPSRSVSA